MTDRSTHGSGRVPGRVNWRPTSMGIELYDERNPDAWIRVALPDEPDDLETDADPAGADGEVCYLLCETCGSVPLERRPEGAVVCSECGRG